jgi:magnesium transporter
VLLLSDLLRFDVADESGQRQKLVDLSVTLLEGDYPDVTNIFYAWNGQTRRLPWAAVNNLSEDKKCINVSSLESGEKSSIEGTKDYVLLRCEIMDALVLDLQNRRSIRANDLQLEYDAGTLCLKAADTSLSAVLRRITRGLYNRHSSGGLYDWKYVEFLRGDPAAVRHGAGYHLRINRLPPGEIAQLAGTVPYLHAAELITLLPDNKAARTLEVMPLNRQLQVFEELDEETAVRLLAIMAPDAAADLVGLIETKTMRSYLEQIPRKQSERIVELLRYSEESVGGIMTNDILCLEESLTVARAREKLGSSIDEADFVYLIYIVGDAKNRDLRGMVPLKTMFAADDNKKLGEIMDSYISTLAPNDPAREASYRVIGSQLAAMPVVGENRKLVGALTIDAAIMQITPVTYSESLRIFS